LADPSEPGSVIVFPKFSRFTPVNVDGLGPNNQLPRTEIEIGAVCPAGLTCFEHQPVKVRFHWVCPGAQSVGSKFVCPETDFDVVLTINGKLAFSADGTALNGNSPPVPQPNCDNGYLIGWVIDFSDRPIKFDGLIGDAVLRGPNVNPLNGPAGLSTAVEGYKAITIQAAANTNTPVTGGGGLPAFQPISTVRDDPFSTLPTLAFDGGVNHYQAITGNLYGDVKFDRTTAGGAPTPSNLLSETFLILLTLDVRSNQPNYPTFVPLQFYNESSAGVSGTNPAFERLVSGSTEFLCWTQVQLSQQAFQNGTLAPNPNGIDPNLTQTAMTTRKGLVHAGPAVKVPFIGISDTSGPATLIGLVQTIEGTAANSLFERSYIYNMFDDSVPVPTRFLPFPF